MIIPNGNGISEDLAALPNDAGITDLPLALTGDAGELLQSFRPYLLAIANARLPAALAGKVAPSDVVQETLLRGLNGFAEFRGATPAHLLHWLRTILHRQMITAQRRYACEKRRDRPAVPAVQLATSLAKQPSPSDVAMSHEDREALEQALECLPDDQRQAILMRHREDLSFREIGERLQRSEEAARKLWGRGVVRLQKELRGDDCGTGAIAESAAE